MKCSRGKCRGGWFARLLSAAQRQLMRTGVLLGLVMIVWSLLVALSLSIAFGQVADVRTPVDLGRWGYPEGTIRMIGPWATAYDGRTRTARWTLHYLDAQVLAGQTPRPVEWREDETVPVEYRAQLEDYARSGYDRGHLVPLGDFGALDDRLSTMVLSNAAPQLPIVNRGIWREVEMLVRGLVTADARAWVITCPLFLAVDSEVNYRTLGKGVAVPTHFGKAVLLVRAADQEPELLAWIVPNRAVANELTPARFQVSVDEFERAAGLDVWTELPDPLERQLEAQGRGDPSDDDRR